jgi:small neutral amino acid transporter SnatA (MarC family)
VSSVFDIKFFWQVFVTLLVIMDPPGVVPLGTPLLAGPGAIVATMVFVQRGGTVAQFTAFSVVLVAVTLLLWLTMRFSGVILRILRPSGVELLTRSPACCSRPSPSSSSERSVVSSPETEQKGQL